MRLIRRISERDLEILDVCKNHLTYMWAAKITGIILGCDFKDSMQELQKVLDREALKKIGRSSKTKFGDNE